MSSTVFRSQVTQLLSELTRCYELCTEVRKNRRIGKKHEALDALQDEFSSSITSLRNEYDTQRIQIGPQMDIGDEQARQEINDSIRAVSNDLRTRLEDIAYKRDSSDGGHSHSSRGGHSHGPGFRDLLLKWQRIERRVENTFYYLSRRLSTTTVPATGTSTSAPAVGGSSNEGPRVHKKDEVVISLRELDRLMEHMKISWEETDYQGRLLYVNCFDKNISQWERPEGAYVKPLRRMGSWERVSPGSRQDTSGRGW